jgi:AAA15 family ATPase/GTPase
MPLTRIEIVGYRGFLELGTLTFATPNGKPGSGLTILTGSNNAGKSTILECLRTRSGGQSPSFTVGARNATVDNVEITFFAGDEKEVLKSVAKGSSETKRSGTIQNLSIFVLPSRRSFNPYFGRNVWSREQWVTSTPLPAQRSSVLSNFESRLFAIADDPRSFNDLLEQALGVKSEWTIDQSDQGSYFLKFYNGKHPHSSDGMGDGVISIFAIVDSLYDSKPGDVIVIDEPELSLHPSFQKRVAILLRRFSSDRQIIISTHSPYFVDLESLANGADLARIVATDRGTKINQLSDPTKALIARLSASNLYNPHVFGLDARELFFQEERIILTEGQEDVLLYPKIAVQLQTDISGSFFGWGAGGVGNVANLCVILQELGFKKVAALLDGNQTLKLRLLKKRFPDYFFEEIPAADIRTKAARPATGQVEGLVDQNLNLNPEFSDAVSGLFSRLSSHMNS